MCQMMLYRVEGRSHILPRNGFFEVPPQTRASATISYPAEHEVEVGSTRDEIRNLAPEIGPTVLVESNVIYIGQLYTGFPQAVGHSLRRKSGPMLDTPEALFLGRRDQF